MSVPDGSDLLAHIENMWPKLGIYLRRYVTPAIQSRGLPGQVLATPTDKPGPVQLQNLSDLTSIAGVGQIVAGTNIDVTPSSGKGVVTVSSTSGGTVTSVDITVPSWQSVAGVPITNVGTAVITDNNQSANKVFAGPATGADAPPAFRALVAGDIPSVPPSGAAGGDLSGTYPNPTVHQVNGAAVPVSQALVGTNSSGQIIPATSAGTVTTVSVATANGFQGTVANPTTTPAISVNVDGTHYLPTTTDETNWNAKQPAGNYITALTGDGTASGPGSSAFTAVKIPPGVTLTGTPSSGMVPTATSSSAATWQTPAASAIQVVGSAVFNGTSGISSATYKGVISSVTRASTGTYTVNFSTLAAGYTVSILCGSDNVAVTGWYINGASGVANLGATSFSFTVVSVSALTARDSGCICVTIFN